MMHDLRPYQQDIATHLYEHDAALCVLRPGGGKTAAALLAIAELLNHNVIRHALILAPKRVARVVWPDEITQWPYAAALRYAVLDGSPAARTADLMTAPGRHLTIVGLDVIPWLIEQQQRYPADHPLFDLLVIDEISKLRNPTGVRSKIMAKNAAKWRMIWGLSGTLRPNSAQDLFAPARIVSKGKLWGNSFYSWRKTRFYPADYHGYDWQPFPGAEDHINRDIAPLTISVPEHEIPKVTPHIIFDKVVLPAGARQEYDRMLRELVTVTDAGDTVVASSAAVATGKLAQLANGFIYENAEEEDAVGSTSRVHDAKREWLRDIVEDAAGPTLLIYEYQADLDLLRAEVAADIPYLGSGISDKAAAQNIADWNAGKLPFMALHPASGGHGLNLQFGGADMCWIAPTWSPELWEQTIARIARPGQPRAVMVRVCVAEDTVDDMKLARVYHKLSAQQAFEQWLRRQRISDHV
jgi:SNF2-related domain